MEPNTYKLVVSEGKHRVLAPLDYKHCVSVENSVFPKVLRCKAV